MKLPKTLEHLQKFEEYAKPIRKGVWGFYIPQWHKDGTINHKWLEFRNYTLGASDVSSVLGINPWKSKLRLHWDKVENKVEEKATQLMITGHSFEPVIAQWWEYWDGEDWIQNYLKRERQRTCRQLNCFVVNEKYPYLAVSYDRIVNANQYNPHTGEIMDFHYPLEIKNISRFSKSTGISPYYLTQVCVQQMVWEVEYSEWIANIGNATTVVLDIDGREGSSLAPQLNQMKEHINNVTHHFMANVHECKELHNQLISPSSQLDKGAIEIELIQLEPQGVEEIEDVENFLKERYSPDSIELHYNDEYVQDLCQMEANANYLIEQGEKWKQTVKNIVLKKLDSNGVIKTESETYFKYIPATEERKRSYYKANLDPSITHETTLELAVMNVSNIDVLNEKYFAEDDVSTTQD